MKVAILCSGLGSVTRGYERFADDLNRHLRPYLDVEAFGSGGKQATSPVKTVRHLSRSGILSRIPAIVGQRYRNPYYWEAMTFSASVLPRLIQGRYDIIHVMDPPIINFLHRARRLLSSSKLVFTNGVGMHDVACTRVDHLHQVSKSTFEEAKTYLGQDRMSLIPYPIDAEKLSRPISVGQHEARIRLQVPMDAFVVVSVAALNRGHKRVDYLIHEVAGVPDAHLLSVGRVEDETLVRLGRQVLGDRFIHRQLPFEAISLAYRSGDVFALTSLEEGFAISVVEAMMLGVPVLVHHNEHFRWLIGDEVALADMTKAGSLASALQSAREPVLGVIEARRDRALSRFSWQSLLPAYLEMYRRTFSA